MKIAIQGHPTRGKEVIQLLESLGGINKWNHTGECVNYAYYIDYCNNIYSFGISGYHGDRKIYTLEAFEKEFPFKIGDKVTITGTSHPKIITGITDTQWGLRYVISEIKFPDSKEMPHISQISLYKEMKEERNITLTLEKAKEWYKKGGELKEIALQAFTEKELTKLDLPKTWVEFCKNYPIRGEVFYIDRASDIQVIPSCATYFRDEVADRNICPSKKSAEAHLAMIQLEQLRDCWRQRNIPQGLKYKIRRVRDKYTIVYGEEDAFLSFCNKQTAEEFLECFRDLIEKVGDLI